MEGEQAAPLWKENTNSAPLASAAGCLEFGAGTATPLASAKKETNSWQQANPDDAGDADPARTPPPLET